MGDCTEIRFKPIGVVHTKGSNAEVKAKGDLESEPEIYREFAEGLNGIVGYLKRGFEQSYARGEISREEVVSSKKGVA